MFGLESQNKKPGIEEFTFDLEKELKSTDAHKKMKLKLEARIQEIREVLRTGENKEEFDRFGVLLHGYNALLKVLSRFKTS